MTRSERGRLILQCVTVILQIIGAIMLMRKS